MAGTDELETVQLDMESTGSGRANGTHQLYFTNHHLHFLFLWVWLWVFRQAAAVGAVFLCGRSGAGANCIFCFMVAILYHGTGGMAVEVFGVQEVATQ